MLSPHKGASIHLDRGYDSFVTRERLKERGLDARIAKKGQQSAPLQAGQRWVVERTNSWHNGPPVTPLGGAWLQKVAGDVPLDRKGPVSFPAYLCRFLPLLEPNLGNRLDEVRRARPLTTVLRRTRRCLEATNSVAWPPGAVPPFRRPSGGS
jgi:hypothetical protein